MNLKKLEAEAKKQAAEFNAKHPVGTVVDYWRGARRGPASGRGKTRGEAVVMGCSAVVWIVGAVGYVALSHVRVLPPGETSVRREIWWDAGNPNDPANAAWPCGWCWGVVSLDAEGEVIDSTSGALDRVRSGVPDVFHTYTDNDLRVAAVAQFGEKWRTAEVDRKPRSR